MLEIWFFHTTLEVLEQSFSKWNSRLCQPNLEINKIPMMFIFVAGFKIPYNTLLVKLADAMPHQSPSLAVWYIICFQKSTH